MTQTLSPLDSLFFEIILATLAIGLTHRHCLGRPLPLGPPPEPRPFQGTRQARLAIAPHRQRHGTSNELVLSSRSTRHRRGSRSRVSPAPGSASRPSTQSCGSSRRSTRSRQSSTGSACSAIARSSPASCRRARFPAPARTSRSCRRGPARWSQLHVRPVDFATRASHRSASLTDEPSSNIRLQTR